MRQAVQSGPNRSRRPHSVRAASNLDSPDAGLRRRAAIELGRVGNAQAVEPLIEALRQEQEDLVRASLVLALGALGGAHALTTLAELIPAGRAETAALVKALDRLTGKKRAGVAWREGLNLGDVHLEVPQGLEHPLSRRLVQEGLPKSETVRPGLLRLLQPVPATRLDPPPRYIYNLRLPLAQTEPGLSDSAAIQILLKRAAETRSWRTWVAPDSADKPIDLPYRLVMEGREPNRTALRSWLDHARAAFAPLGMADSPSAYSCEMVVSWLGPQPTLFFRPRFGVDRRFAYRKRDVNASINPVVAAALVQLIPAPLTGAVLDPTCGSATLLVERALLDKDARLVGIDVSAAALAAARTNLEAAALSGRAILRESDARDPAAWSPCGVLLANLPFGIRSGRDDPDLGQLYRAILVNADTVLGESGRVLLGTANRSSLERAVAAAKVFRILAKYRVQTGGLYVHVVVLGRKAASSGKPARKDQNRATAFESQGDHLGGRPVLKRHHRAMRL